MIFDPFFFPYPSRRRVVYAGNGMVATSQYLAAQAGLDILKKGGNAIDAAVATAACLTVVEPTSNGIGGDAFAIIWHQGKLYGLNASGPAPKSISWQLVRELGYREMPKLGWLPVTVPGTPSAWATLHRTFGSISFSEILKPAINYAERGFPVSSVVSRQWEIAFKRYAASKDESLQSWFSTFAPFRKVPEPGEIWKLPQQAETLQLIADSRAEAFYRGALAEKIASFSQKNGGYLKREDLDEYSPEWVEPIKINYRGYDLWEIPPNGQGLITLMALNILNGFKFLSKDDPQTYHLQIEAMKLAFSVGKEVITDPKEMRVRVEELLTPNYAEKQRRLIGEEAFSPCSTKPLQGGTVYLATADNQGNVVSYIQSNYTGFGSGIVIPGTGIALQNRGNTFSLNPQDANCLKPGKKTYHTIIPGFLTREKEVAAFGVMGAYMQPQGQLQVISNILDFKLNPQAALDAPRWQWIEEKKVKVEQLFPHFMAERLVRKGHQIEMELSSASFGKGQIIWRDSQGVLLGATDPRADGMVAAW